MRVISQPQRLGERLDDILDERVILVALVPLDPFVCRVRRELALLGVLPVYDSVK